MATDLNEIVRIEVDISEIRWVDAHHIHACGAAMSAA
jgi:hypothetical protein